MIRILFLLLLFSRVYSQGLIVNEISNGTSGTKEFIELLVVGSVSQPIGLVDISGWVIDDNNGEFESSSGAGVAQGHYRFVSYPPIPIGSIIVVYNIGDINTNMIVDDPLDSNLDGIYVLPINSVYIERCTSIPSSTLGTSYTPCSYTSSLTQTWLSMGFRNGGDVAQVRKPDYSFYHGFSYGDVLTPYPIFPNGNTSFNVRTGSGTVRNYFLDCGDWTLQTSYQRGDANFDTPGLPNTLNNSILISNIRSGLFNYSNLSDPSNCVSQILNQNDLNFRTESYDTDVFLMWNVIDDYDEYELQRSSDGILFDSVDVVYDGMYLDVDIYQSMYYRLKLTNLDDVDYSKIIYVNYDNYKSLIYPNPFDYNLIINVTSLDEFKIYNMIGQVVLSGTDNVINTINLDSGCYIIYIKIGDKYFLEKVLKY